MQKDTLPGSPADATSPLYQRLLRAREAARLTQDQLAQRSGVARPTIYRCESGRYDARLSTVTELARALGLELMLVPKQLSAELAGFIQSNGKLLGQPAGVDAPRSVMEQMSRQLDDARDDGGT